ncbi:hypothetical protein [Robertmurraya korlensis]|uniref:hypothetical protein n=1 Tax=Robertmurraya korlensis TaxID=519977 RepID=UPI0008245D1E|nr:hypothetical protein [Robertmurraya korlensis]
MELMLQQILDKLQAVENNQLDMRKDIQDIKIEQTEMKVEQREMRKEVAFYYGTMMKKLDEVKIELSSEIKHISSVPKQH